MSSFGAISGVSRTLQALLKRYITDTSLPEFGGARVELGPPSEIADDETSIVSLWLYQIERNAELLNQPRVRSASDRLEHQPFPVNLHYLVTPITSSAENCQALLGRIVQVFHDHAIIEPPLLAAGMDAPFRISFQPLSLEELTRVWDALKEPYQLSVAYLVQVVNIDSLRPAERVLPVRHASVAVGLEEPLA